MSDAKHTDEPLIRIAAIDIGTNSAHLVIAEADHQGHIKVLDTHREVLKLGACIEKDTRNLSQDGIDKTVGALHRMKEIAENYKPVFRAVCTHAIRNARNFELVLETIQTQTQIHVEPIDGIEESRLAALGMQFGLHLKDTRFLGVDIGGGSTELSLIHISEPTRPY